MRSRTRKKAPPKDINSLAASIVDQATAGPDDKEPRQKNPAAVALGRLGGLVGGKARAKALSKKDRHDIAQKAARARWKRSKK